jgi:protoporphyrinogen oxidase
MKRVIVLGAGLSGLGFARTYPGAKVFEAAAHPGGHAWSHELQGVFFDEGAHICHAKDPQWLDLLYQQAGDVARIERSSVSNYWHGSWVTYPVQNFLCDLPADAREAAVKDFLRAQELYRDAAPANYLEWCRFQYGDFLTERFYAEYTRKYWRVPMEELGTDWLSGRLIPAQVERILAGARERQSDGQAVFTRFHYPARGGFFSFFAPLYRSIDVTCGARAVRVDARRREVQFEDGRTEGYETLASSIPLPDLVRMMPDAPAAIRESAAALRHTQLLCVNLLVRRTDLTPHHWFYIYDEDIDVARVSVPGNVSPGSVPAGFTALQAEIFRRHDESIDAEALAAKAVKDLGRIMGFEARDVTNLQTVRVPHAYVVSDARRAVAVETITSWLGERDISAIGLFGAWKFIWSDAAYASGARAAEQLMRKRE